MTEREVIQVVESDSALTTDFSDPHWEGIDPRVLESCFGKGFIRWVGEKLIITPLGRRSCTGVEHERHH